MKELKTHLKIDTKLCGEVIDLEDGYAKVLLKTSQKMAADERALVHGGFCFGAADLAAMVAVNDPYVVLFGASSRFLAPVRVGDEVYFDAHVIELDGRKQRVEVKGRVKGKEIFEGIFETVILKSHVFDL